jgi:hypothetical protein
VSKLPKYYGISHQATIIYIISKIVCKLFPCPPSPMAICFVILRSPRGPYYLLGAPMFFIQLKSCRQVDGALRVILGCLELDLQVAVQGLLNFENFHHWKFNKILKINT